MKLRMLAASIVMLAASSKAQADFAVDGISMQSSERGPMGGYVPYEPRGMASFTRSDGEMAPRQARYKDAELLVDLAYSSLTERGNGTTAAMVEGFADDVPFASAMSMIAPSGWHIYKDNDLDKKLIPERISFIGGKPWPDVLKDIGERSALQFHLDWYDRTVMIKKGRPAPAMDAAKIAVIAEPPKASTFVAPSSAITSPSASAPDKSEAVVVTGTAGELSKLTAPIKPGITTGTNPAQTLSPKPAAPAIPTSWSVSPSDKTIREALARWAKIATWSFEPEHWSVGVDIPLTASATFQGDFKIAVRQLISTTELSDTPLQPCFYSNRVVRVVPFNEMCDRMSVR